MEGGEMQGDFSSILMPASMEERLGGILQNSPSVISLILNNFSHRDLTRCSGVCKSWLSYSKKIAGGRRKIENYLAVKKYTTRANRWAAVSELEDVKQFFKQLRIVPREVLLFGKLPLSRPCIGGNDLVALRERLHPDAIMFGFICSQGIVGTDQNGRSRELQTPKQDCFSAFLFPRLPDVSLIHFNLSLDTYQREIEGRALSAEALERLFQIPAGLKVGCLVLVSSDYFPFDIGEEVARAFWTRQQGGLALCGGVAETIFQLEPGRNEVQDPGLFGLAICGPSVVAASVVVTGAARTKEDLGKKMLELRPVLNPPPKQSLAFHFVCAARGRKLFNAPDMESSVFRELFPDTPIAGLFSLGEYGWDFSPNQNPVDPDTCCHSYTSCIALIAIR